jgi:hypothetical protein
MPLQKTQTSLLKNTDKKALQQELMLHIPQIQ